MIGEVGYVSFFDWQIMVFVFGLSLIILALIIIKQQFDIKFLKKKELKR